MAGMAWSKSTQMQRLIQAIVESSIVVKTLGRLRLLQSESLRARPANAKMPLSSLATRGAVKKYFWFFISTLESNHVLLHPVFNLHESTAELLETEAQINPSVIWSSGSKELWHC